MWLTMSSATITMMLGFFFSSPDPQLKTIKRHTSLTNHILCPLARVFRNRRLERDVTLRTHGRTAAPSRFSQEQRLKIVYICDQSGGDFANFTISDGRSTSVGIAANHLITTHNLWWGYPEHQRWLFMNMRADVLCFEWKYKWVGWKRNGV